MTADFTLARLERALATRTPRLEVATAEDSRAAVAIILRPDAAGAGDVLFIQRAIVPNDPWSGQVAFPGGRADARDASLLDTAVRETREEIGGDLATVARLIGTLDEIHPRTPVLPPIVVRPHVFILERDLPIVHSDEVADTFWVSLQTLMHPATTQERDVQGRSYRLRVSSFVVGERVIWGMTERFLRQLLGLLDE